MRYALPEKIGNDEYFAWGPVTNLHKIEYLDIIIVEYVNTNDKTTTFHPYLNGNDCSSSFAKFEEALIFAISCKTVGFNRAFNNNHAYFACKILEI